MTTALVLAGGGLAGIAWELGVLRGLADADPGLAEAVTGADRVTGTSAGSAVAVQVTSGAHLDALFEAQLGPATGEIDAEVDLEALVASFGEAVAGVTDPDEVKRRIAGVALKARTVPEADRLAAVSSRLPRSHWPDRDLWIVAVDAYSGQRVAFTRDSGVSLLDAVTASCAVPGVWPPVTIEESRFVDGGAHSGANADLAIGCERVLVISPTLPDAPAVLGRALGDEVAELVTAGARVHVVHADDASIEAFGTNPLATATRVPSAEAGRALGRAVAADVAAFWTP